MGKNLTFGQAIEYLKNGRKVKRKDWGGYWFIPKMVHFDRPINRTMGESISVNVTILACLKDNGGYAPAQPYQADILAEDWEVVE